MIPDRPRRGSETAGEPGDPDSGLAAVAETETVGDLVDTEAFAGDLPPGWGVVADVAPFEDEPLVEVLRVRRSPGDPALVLKPVELSNPGGRVACYERGVDGSRNRIGTADTLEAAVRVATNWAHQRTG